MSLRDISNQIAVAMTLFVMPCVVILNLFAIYIFSRPKMQKTNMGFLYTWQFTVDTLIVISYSLIFRSEIIFGFDMYSVSELACKFFSFYQRLLLSFSPWIIVFVAFDRYRFVHCPTRFKLMKEKRNLTAIIGVIFVVLVLLTSVTWFFRLEVVESASHNGTFVTECSSSFVVGASSDMINILVRSVVPIFLIFFFDLTIIRDLIASKSRVKSKIQRREIQFTLTVVCSNLAFFLVSIPFGAVLICKYVFSYFGLSYSKSEFEVYYSLAADITSLYLVLGFVNLFIVNSLFRFEVLNALRCVAKRPSLHPPTLDDKDNQCENLM